MTAVDGRPVMTLDNKDETENRFDRAAEHWDTSERVAVAKAVGGSILRVLPVSKDMDVLDYGAGTGLISLFLLPHVRSVAAADSSTGMLAVLEQKVAQQKIVGLTPLKLDLEHDDPLPAEFRLITCVLVLHHVVQPEKVLRGFYQMLPPGGLLCLVDLDSDNGLFHCEEAAQSVHHQGFERVQLIRLLENLGFTELRSETAHTITKPGADGVLHDFPVFIITGKK